MKPSSVISTKEVASLLSTHGRGRLYYELYRGRIRNCQQNLSGYGWQISRAGFLAWLADHPECRADTSALPDSAVEQP